MDLNELSAKHGQHMSDPAESDPDLMRKLIANDFQARKVRPFPLLLLLVRINFSNVYLLWDRNSVHLSFKVTKIFPFTQTVITPSENIEISYLDA